MMWVVVLSLLVLGALLLWVRSSSGQKRQQAEEWFQETITQLEQSPLEQRLHTELLSLAKDYPALSQEAYEVALSILAENPDSLVAKGFALIAGRQSYSAARLDKKPTVYDENAIQNDIMIRTGNAVRQDPVTTG